jgi:hypothetical protein
MFLVPFVLLLTSTITASPLSDFAAASVGEISVIFFFA